MINSPTNEELASYLRPLKKFQSFSIVSRKILDQGPFSKLEVIDFKEIPYKSYILKSVRKLFANEVILHEYATNFKLNGAQFIFGQKDLKKDYFIILMEKIDDLIPIYFIDKEDIHPFLDKFVRSLAKFHIESSKDINLLMEKGIPVYGFKNYVSLSKSLYDRILKFKSKTNHPFFLTDEILKEFQFKSIEVIKIFKKVENSKFSLVHGDLDFGNIFVKNINEICILDWGMAHIDNPIIDVANLFNSLRDLDLSQFHDLLNLYYKNGKPLFSNRLKLKDIQKIGTLMHLIYFINFNLNVVEMKIIDPHYYLENIHKGIVRINELT